MMPSMGRAIRGVELFQAGNYRGEDYTPEYLLTVAKNNAILRNADLLKPDLGIGHGKQPDAPATFSESGWPQFGDINRVGIEYRYPEGASEPVMTLVGDFAEVPDKLAYLIHQGAYRHVSAEFYDNLPEQIRDHVEGPVLKRVALLGETVPQVKTLEDVTNTFREQCPDPDFDFDAPKALRALKPVGVVRNEQAGTVVAFSEVVPMSKPAKTFKKFADLNAASRATIKKFADAPEGETPSVTREELIAVLGDAGFDVSTITAETPEAVLLEMARVLRMSMEESAKAKAETVNNGDKPEDKPAEKKEEVKEMSNKNLPADWETKLKTFAEQQAAPIKAELEALKKQTAADATQLKRMATANTAASIRAFCEQARKDRKLLPAEIDAGIVDVMTALAEVPTVVTFADGKQSTLLEKFKAVILARPALKVFADALKPGPVNQDQEVATVRTFADDNATQLKHTGQTKEQFVQRFIDQRKTNEQLTAAEFLGQPAA